jgi:putative two-component system response regulator
MPQTALSRLQDALSNSKEVHATELREALGAAADDLTRKLTSGNARDCGDVLALVQLVEKVPPDLDPGLRLQCFVDSARFLYVFGRPFDAIDPAKDAISLAESSGDLPRLRKAITLLGVMYADTGNVSSAIECYAKALELAQQARDPEAESAVWINLGVALTYCGQFRDALACFEHVLEMASTSPQFSIYRVSALTNIALCALHTEDFSRGLKAAELAVKESPEPHSAAEMLSRVLRETNFVRLLLEINNLEKAQEHCVIAKKFAAQSHSARAEISADISDGLCLVFSGHADVGVSRLIATLEKARLLRSMLRDTLAALVRAFEVMGQPQRALVYLREMMEATRKIQQDNALKHLQIHLASLGREVAIEESTSPAMQRREAALKGQIAEEELFHSRIEMLERLAVTAELRDDSTGEHSYRVGKLAGLLAAEYGCDEPTCFMVELAARLHDIGKIGVPDAILLKPEKLNDAERQVMRTHTTVGAELLSQSNIPHMQMAEDIARHHHEWWDGSGYPGNLSGLAIPLGARIAALADVFDALTHARPYKQAWAIEDALREISELRGSQFDPQITDMFLALIGELRGSKGDLDAFLGQAARSSPFLQARSKIWDTLRRSKQSDGFGADSRLDLQR